MMIKDLRSNIKVLKGMFATINSNTTTTGETINTAPYKSMTLVIVAVSWTDGTYTPVVYEDTDSAMGTEAAIDDTKLIPQSSAETGCVIDAANEVHTLGITGNEQYVRLKIVSTSVSSGATICALWIGEDMVQAVTQG